MRHSFRPLLIAVLAGAALLTGCASVPMTSAADDAAAKSYVAPATKAGLYVYRNESFGGAVKLTLAVNGKLAGQTGPKTYYFWELDPGPVELSSVSENTSTLKLDAQAGKTYYVWQEVKMGMWTAQSKLQEVSADVGRKGVAECKRAQASF
jgi:hypothetical protein